MKRLLIIIILFIVQQLSAQVLVQYYVPSFTASKTYNSGEAALFQFEDNEIDRQFLLPFEVRIPFASISYTRWKNTRMEENYISSFMGNSGVTFYLEDGKLSSINISLGISYNDHPVDSAFNSLNGFVYSFYPLYEFPVITFGKESLSPYKFAFETSLGLFGEPKLPLYLSFYYRWVGYFTRNGGFGTAFDIGMSVGWVFRSNEKTTTPL